MRLHNIIKRNIEEGVSYKSSQRKSALNKKNVLVGLEYEFYADQGLTLLRFTDVKNHFDSYLTHIPYKEIKPEHDSQVELITDTMSISDALKHISLMFQQFKTSTNGVQLGSSDLSGLHISISYKDHAKKNFNALKFAILMNSNYIHSIFPERKHVSALDTVVKNSIKSVLSTRPSNDEIIPLIEKEFYKTHVDDESNIDSKYFTIRLSHYAQYNGRVELRFFGGDGYENMENTIKDQMARAIYLLDIAYGNAFHEEYIKQLHKKIDSVRDELLSKDMGSSVFSKARYALKNNKVNTSIRKDVANEFKKYLQNPSTFGDMSKIEIYKKIYPASFERNYESILERLIAPKPDKISVSFLGSPLEDRISVDVLKYLNTRDKKTVIRDYINNNELLGDTELLEQYFSNKVVKKELENIITMEPFDPKKHIEIRKAIDDTQFPTIIYSFDESTRFGYYIYRTLKNNNIEIKDSNLNKKILSFIEDASEYVIELFESINKNDETLMKPEQIIIDFIEVTGRKEYFKELIASMVGREYHRMNSNKNINSINDGSSSESIKQFTQKIENLLSLLKVFQ